MQKFGKLIIGLFIAVDILLFIWLLVHGNTVTLLQPQGIIADKQRTLILTAISLMMFVGIPIVATTFFVANKYREENNKKYTPDWDRSTILSLRFLIPIITVLILSVMGWNAAHALDPHRALISSKQPITIQVVALNWKWLFIYPAQNIATVNFVEFPVNTPVNFELTSNGLMNSFWIPQLGGQMYAMAGMVNPLHLMASSTGDFDGSAAEINGKGFSDMRFVARSSTQNGFDSWVTSVKQTNNILNKNTYEKLAAPSEHTPVTYYSSVENGLYYSVITKYLPAAGANSQMTNHQAPGY